MKQEAPTVERLALKTAEGPMAPVEDTGVNLRPRDWLLPVTVEFTLLTALVLWALTGDQGSGWMAPDQVPALLRWTGVLSPLFLLPMLQTWRSRKETGVCWQDWVRAPALALAVCLVHWPFAELALLLEPARGPAWVHWLPDGLPWSMVGGLLFGGAWLWKRVWPAVSLPALVAWSALPPLAWYLTVDVVGLPEAHYPQWLYLNPVSIGVGSGIRPVTMPGWAMPVTLIVLWGIPMAWAAIRGRKLRNGVTA